MTSSHCSTQDCTSPAVARGWCKPHYQRWWRHGTPLAGRLPQTEPAAVRFWTKVEFTDTCWLWTANTSNKGYGSFWEAGSTWFLAHRYAYEFCVGPIPEGLDLDHLCLTRNCVLPDHLEPVTHVENARRVRKDHCRRGLHLFTEENTRVYRGKRECLACRIIQRRLRYAAGKG